MNKQMSGQMSGPALIDKLFILLHKHDGLRELNAGLKRILLARERAGGPALSEQIRFERQFNRQADRWEIVLVLKSGMSIGEMIYMLESCAQSRFPAEDVRVALRFTAQLLDFAGHEFATRILRQPLKGQSLEELERGLRHFITVDPGSQSPDNLACVKNLALQYSEDRKRVRIVVGKNIAIAQLFDLMAHEAVHSFLTELQLTAEELGSAFRFAVQLLNFMDKPVPHVRSGRAKTFE